MPSRKNPNSPAPFSHSLHLPAHLAQQQATGIRESEPIAQFEIGPYKNFVYLLLDWTSRKAAVVDPQSDLSPLLAGLKLHGFELTEILITHSHFDHVAGVPSLAALHPNIPIRIHPKDAHRIESQPWSTGRLKPLHDGEPLFIGIKGTGGGLEIQVLHTPGHSAGECSYLVAERYDENSQGKSPRKSEANPSKPEKPPYLLTGDTVFIRDCGRTDLEGGSNLEMFESLQKIRHLPENTIILPGHHYQKECATVLRVELQTSPPFQCHTVEELSLLP